MALGPSEHDVVIGVVGEVYTGLLQHSTELGPAECERLLAVRRGERVRSCDRPIAYTLSPDLLTGLDCQLVTSAGGGHRGVGSATTRAAITGGRILQVATDARLVRSREPRRLPWAHYLARPGQIEIIGRSEGARLADGFLYGQQSAAALDLGAIGVRVMDTIQRSSGLDRRPPLRTQRTRLRWAALVDPARSPGTLRFAVDHGPVRTALLSCTEPQVPDVATFCEDLAIHDWLLTTLLTLVRRSRLGSAGLPTVLSSLRPALDHLLHLWMPAARTGRRASPFWDSLEHRPGLARQWRATVDRVRDQLALHTVDTLATATATSALTTARKESSD